MVRPMFSEPADLANYIRSCTDRLIVFDGRCQAGKTTVMSAMRKELRLPGTDGDKFLVPEFGRRRTFIETLQLDELKAEIWQALRLSDTVLFAPASRRHGRTAKGNLHLCRACITNDPRGPPEGF